MVEENIEKSIIWGCSSIGRALHLQCRGLGVRCPPSPPMAQKRKSRLATLSMWRKWEHYPSGSPLCPFSSASLEHSPCKRDVVGANPTTGSILFFCLGVVQLVEYLFWEQVVVSASLTIQTISRRRLISSVTPFGAETMQVRVLSPRPFMVSIA